MIDTLKVMFGKKVLGPSYPDLPVIDDHAESNIPGLFVIGDISGTALIKMTINQGFKTANEIASRLKGKEDSNCGSLAWKTILHLDLWLWRTC